MSLGHLVDSGYTEYQQYLYDRIKGYREGFLTILTYKEISEIFKKEQLKTPRGSDFGANYVYSIYKKGKIREERLKKSILKEVSVSEVIVHLLP